MAFWLAGRPHLPIKILSVALGPPQPEINPAMAGMMMPCNKMAKSH
jgi:hypothetical protein